MNVRKAANAAAKTLACGVALSTLLITGAAFAQEQTPDAGKKTENKDEIVVTGTLVRGVAPAGTNVIGVSEEDVQETGATTVTQLLQTIPQFGSFNSLQAVSGGGNFVTTNRPNLRDLPGFTTTGTSSTLMLVDGRRVVGMGVSSTTPDADFVPPGIIERVEIVPDGGSAIYGSDAVAGVVNFITRKRFDGAEVDARYGFGEDYHTFDTNVTIGKEWSTGSIWASYNYTENGTILGRDRDYNFTPESKVAGTVVQSLECPNPNVLIGATPTGPKHLRATPLPGTANTANICDLTDGASLYPEQKRHSVYAGLNQQLNDSIELDLRGFYYRKDSEMSLGQFSGSVNLGPAFLAPFGYVTSPYNVNVTGSPAEVKQVNYAIGGLTDNRQSVRIDSWGFTPTITADLGGGWQLRTLASYSESKSVQHTNRLAKSSVINPLVVSGAFNPFDPSTVSAATYATMTNWETYGQADQRQFDVRAVVDGDLFTLPGGAAKLAFGAEYRQEAYDSRKGDTVPGMQNTTLPRYNQDRNIKSVFGELVMPVLGGDSGPALTLSASGRYDDYNDVGDTFNPKFGATFKPVDGVSLRGSWGKSFVAPSLADSSVADPTNLNWVSGATFNFIAPSSVLTANGYPAPVPGQVMMFLLGANPGLQPQKATTWSLGTDIEPTFAPGLRLSATYYNIDYKGLIQLVPFINTNLFWSTFAPSAFTLSPTQAEIDATIAGASIITGTPCAPQPSCVYGIQDVRKRNLGGFKQSGIDFSADYSTATGFGSVDFAINGTYILTRKNSPVEGSPFVSELDTFVSRLKTRVTLGANIGDLRAQVAWNRSSGFDVPPSGLMGQTKVDDFNVIDLFFKYDVPGDGIWNDLALTLNVNNVFNEDPPLYYGGAIVRNQAGYLNGNTVGRLIQLGFTKKF